MASLSWDIFATRGAQLMRDALDDKVTLDEVCTFFETARAIESDDLRQFIVRYICEIDGFRRIYMELLGMLERRATQGELLEYFDIKE